MKHRERTCLDGRPWVHWPLGPWLDLARYSLPFWTAEPRQMWGEKRRRNLAAKRAGCQSGFLGGDGLVLSCLDGLAVLPARLLGGAFHACALHKAKPGGLGSTYLSTRPLLRAVWCSVHTPPVGTAGALVLNRPLTNLCSPFPFPFLPLHPPSPPSPYLIFRLTSSSPSFSSFPSSATSRFLFRTVLSNETRGLPCSDREKRREGGHLDSGLWHI